MKQILTYLSYFQIGSDSAPTQTAPAQTAPTQTTTSNAEEMDIDEPTEKNNDEATNSSGIEHRLFINFSSN